MGIIKNVKKKITTVLLGILVFSLTLIPSNDVNRLGFSPTPAQANLQSDLDSVQQKLAEIKKQKQDINAKINGEKSLQGEYKSEISKIQDKVLLLDLEISEKKLKTDELALQIEILEKKIDQTESDIIDSQITIEDLEGKTDERMASMYMEQKVLSGNIAMVFSSSSSDNFLKNVEYKKAIQDDTNKSLELLSKTRASLELKKKELEESKIQIEKDKAVLDEEKRALEIDLASYSLQKSYFNGLINKSQKEIKNSEGSLSNLSKQEQELQAKLELLKQQIFNSVGSIPNGSRVLARTIIGYEGMTGVATGNHLHFMTSYNGVIGNPCSYLALKTLANTICGVGNPKLATWPMGGTPWLTSGYGWRNGSFHSAIDIASGGSAPIYAAHDGWIVYGNDGACSWYKGKYPCNGAGSKYAKICSDKTKCSNGISTMYFHLK